MAVDTESALLLPPEPGVAGKIIELLEDEAHQLRAGGSSVLFAPGRASSVNTKQLLSVLVVVVGLDDEARERVYRYLFSVQAITHRLRPAIVTDGEDLRAIRRYGWMTEHVMSRGSYESLSPTLPWESWVADRIRSSASRMDIGCVLLSGPDGIASGQHDHLMRRMRQNIPFAVVRH